MQRLIFIFSLFILAIVGCSSNESHSFLIRPDGGGEDAATENFKSPEDRNAETNQ